MVEMLVVVNDLLDRQVNIKCLDGRLDTTEMAPELIKLIVGILGYASEIELKHLKRRTAEGPGTGTGLRNPPGMDAEKPEPSNQAEGRREQTRPQATPTYRVGTGA